MKRSCVLLLAILPLAPALGLEQEEVRAFTIRSDKRSATVSAENRWIAPEAAGADRSGLYRQSVELDFSGSVYHPNFLAYALASRLGVSEWESGTAGPATAYGLIADLHFLASFLQEKPYPFSFHFDRRDDYQEYSLFERARVAETALGGSGRWDNGWAPLLLSVEQSWKEEQQAARTVLQDELVLRAGLERASDDRRNLSRADYTLTVFDRRTVGLSAQQGSSHEARLANSFAFGGARQHGLSSALRYLALSGTLRAELRGPERAPAPAASPGAERPGHVRLARLLERPGVLAGQPGAPAGRPPALRKPDLHPRRGWVAGRVGHASGRACWGPTWICATGKKPASAPSTWITAWTPSTRAGKYPPRPW